MSETEQQIRIRIDAGDDLDAARELADQERELNLHSLTGEPSAGFEGQLEPVTAVLIGAGVVTLAKFVMEWWERRRGGLVIDQRETAQDDLYRDPDVPYGYIVIYPPKTGPVRVETQDAPKDAIQQLLESVLGGLLKQPGAVTDKATTLFGVGAVTAWDRAGG